MLSIFLGSKSFQLETSSSRFLALSVTIYTLSPMSSICFPKPFNLVWNVFISVWKFLSLLCNAFNFSGLENYPITSFSGFVALSVTIYTPSPNVFNMLSKAFQLSLQRLQLHLGILKLSLQCFQFFWDRKLFNYYGLGLSCPCSNPFHSLPNVFNMLSKAFQLVLQSLHLHLEILKLTLQCFQFFWDRKLSNYVGLRFRYPLSNVINMLSNAFQLGL